MSLKLTKLNNRKDKKPYSTQIKSIPPPLQPSGIPPIYTRLLSIVLTWSIPYPNQSLREVTLTNCDKSISGIIRTEALGSAIIILLISDVNIASIILNVLSNAVMLKILTIKLTNIKEIISPNKFLILKNILKMINKNKNAVPLFIVNIVQKNDIQTIRSLLKSIEKEYFLSKIICFISTKENINSPIILAL